MMSETPCTTHKNAEHRHPINLQITGLLLLALVSACTHNPVLEPLDVPGRTEARTFALECERNFAFIARTEGDAIWLFLPGHAVQIPRDRSQSGNSYSGNGIRFHLDQAQAQLELPDRRYVHCRNNPYRAAREHAKLNGVDFRATGSAPDWSLEITLDKKLELVTPSKGRHYRFITPSPTVLERERKTLYSAQNKLHQIIIELISKPCRDTTVNATFDITVTVWLDEQVYHGCGEALH